MPPEQPLKNAMHPSAVRQGSAQPSSSRPGIAPFVGVYLHSKWVAANACAAQVPLLHVTQRQTCTTRLRAQRRIGVEQGKPWWAAKQLAHILRACCHRASGGRRKQAKERAAQNSSDSGRRRAADASSSVDEAVLASAPNGSANGGDDSGSGSNGASSRRKSRKVT